MYFINLRKESIVSSLGLNRAALSVRGNTSYLTPLVRYISSISSCHVHLHCILRPLKDPWLGFPPGGHWPAPAAACNSSLMPSASRSQSSSRPSTCMDSEESDGGSQHSTWRVFLSPAVLAKGLLSYFPFPFDFLVSSFTLPWSLVSLISEAWKNSYFCHFQMK